MDFITWFCLISPLILIFYFYVRHKYSYFKNRNVPYIKPTPLIGNMFLPVLMGDSIVESFVKISSEFRNEPYIGNFDFLNPSLIIQDPEIIKQVGIKNFDNFVNHVAFTDSVSDELLNSSLILMKFQKWRDMRASVSPAFTGLKMRMMFDLMRKCAENFVSFTNESCASSDRITIEPKKTFSKLTVDVISTCAFGLEVDCLRHPDNEMYLNAQRLSNMASPLLVVKFILFHFLPKFAKWLDLSVIPKETGKFVRKIITETISHRKKTGFYRPDILQLLMEARDGKLQHEVNSEADDTGFATIQESEIDKREVKREWTDNEIIGQCLIFFLAGFDTVSTVMNFACYELAIDQEIQDKLYVEILSVHQSLGGNAVSYEILMKMEYLDAFLCELLRKHPGQPGVDRICNADTTINDGKGKHFTIPKGMGVFINTFGLHYNPKYFPNPEKFKPERFLGENKKNIKPHTFMPFGVGPRACIGSRFALMQTKLILYHVILNFKVGIGEKMCIPFRYKKGFKMEPAGCFVELIKRN